MKKIVIFLILVLIILNINNISFSTTEGNHIYLNSSSKEIEKDEEFEITINVSNMKVAAFDVNIYFDSNLLEYVSGPENTNIVENKIITIWYDETGGEKLKQNCELVRYKFKAKEIESEYIAIQGKFYSETGEILESFTDGIEIIAKEEKQTEIIEISEQSQVESSNSKLKILRLNHEGLSPVFSPDVTKYYFLTENLIQLEVIAIPENDNSQVNITGNTNFVEGLNIIKIEVISEDKSNKTEYIIYATKTKDIEKANANLETLAIENVSLEPEFANNIYQYNVNVSNITQKLNILAIPEKQNAKVEIIGGENLQTGNNEITVNVIAENGYTTKQYKVHVYKRNEKEQEIVEQELKNNQEKLNDIIEEQENNEEEVYNENIVQNIEKNKWIISLYIIISIIIITIVIYRIKKEKIVKNRKKVNKL